MSNIIITIGREFGSGGHMIGEKLAQKLGFTFYDKELIDLAASKSGIHPDILKGADEIAGSPFSNPLSNPGFNEANINDKLFQYQKELIKELASKESCVIVGRCADYVLKEYKNCIRVFIYADMDYKINQIKERHNLKDIDLIEKIIKRTDKNRKTYYQYYTDQKWGSKEHNDLLINSAILGVDSTVELIASAVLLKQKELDS